MGVPWLPLAAALVVGGLVLGSAWLLEIGALVAAAGVLARLWSGMALAGVTYTRRLSRPAVFAGETVELVAELANAKLLPAAWVRVTDDVPDGLDFGARALSASTRPRRRALVHLAALRPYERTTWRYPVGCPARGFYLFGPVQLESGDIFGLYPRQREEAGHGRLLVYPNLRPLAQLGFPAGDPFGGRRADRPLTEDPLRPVGVREYRPEDSRRHVDWKATARQGDLRVRVHEPASEATLVVVLNVATFSQTWIGVDPQVQEAVIAVAASIAEHALAHGHAVGLTANGSVPSTGRAIHVPAGRHPGALARILEALAAITAFVKVPVEQLVVGASRRAPWGATLVVVTAVVSDALRAELVRLRRAGRRVVLVSLDDGFSAATPGIQTHHVPRERLIFGGGLA